MALLDTDSANGNPAGAATAATTTATRRPSILRQPPAVWAIAFAATVSFMGIGLVDPILPTIAEKLDATPTQSELLFTTYLALTGVAMFFTSWVSSRIGIKKTLLTGLALVVLFAACSGLTPWGVDSIIGFRAGWGIGNALFISTALAAIVGAAAGGSANAIILYETALGVGMALGPLAGGLLGSISWRIPFLGTTALMAIGFVAIAVMLRGNVPPKPAKPTHLSAPFEGMKVPGLGIMGTSAFFYNMAFFTVLAFPPFVLAKLGYDTALSLGFIFFGWGALLALAAVFVAPWLTRRLRRTTVLLIAMPMLGTCLLGMACFALWSAPGVVVFVVLSGIPLGLLNTVLTECSMEATDLPRPVASSAYSGCRFLGGAIAPPLCTVLDHLTNEVVPFLYGGAMIMVAFAIVYLGRGHLRRADLGEETAEQEAEAITLGDAV